jgi:hypothetical protein
MREVIPLLAAQVDPAPSPQQGYSRKGSENVIGPMPAMGGVVKTDADLWKIIAWIPVGEPILFVYIGSGCCHLCSSQHRQAVLGGRKSRSSPFFPSKQTFVRASGTSDFVPETDVLAAARTSANPSSDVR